MVLYERVRLMDPWVDSLDDAMLGNDPCVFLAAKIITTRWIDTSKDDDKHPDYRARLVGREMRLTRDPVYLQQPHLLNHWE